MAKCAHRRSSIPLGKPMEIDLTGAYLHYQLPPMQQNGHSDYFLDQLRAFLPPFDQSPLGLPITEGLLFAA